MTRDEDLIRGYAEGLFAVAMAEGVLPTVENELYGFAQALQQDTPLREALTDATLPAENKKAVIHDLLDERTEPVTLNLLGFVIDAGRARHIPAIVDTLVRMAAGRREHVLAEVRSAVELTAQQQDRMGKALSQATGSQVDVKVIVDPAVVGGVVARVQDEVFDGSIASRLTNAKQQLGS